MGNHVFGCFPVFPGPLATYNLHTKMQSNQSLLSTLQMITISLLVCFLAHCYTPDTQHLEQVSRQVKGQSVYLMRDEDWWSHTSGVRWAVLVWHSRKMASSRKCSNLFLNVSHSYFFGRHPNHIHNIWNTDTKSNPIRRVCTQNHLHHHTVP